MNRNISRDSQICISVPLTRFNKTQEISPSVTRVLRILLAIAAISESVERANCNEHIA